MSAPDQASGLVKELASASLSFFAELFQSFGTLVALVYTLLFQQFQLLAHGLEDSLSGHLPQIGLVCMSLLAMRTVSPWLFWKVLAYSYDIFAYAVFLFNPIPYLAFVMGFYDSMKDAWIETGAN